MTFANVVVVLLTAGAVAAGSWVVASGAVTNKSSTTVGPGQQGFVKALCKRGRLVVGANAHGESGGDPMTEPLVALGTLLRSGVRRVAAGGVNFGATPGKLSAKARCRRGPKSGRVSHSVALPPAGAQIVVESATAKCPPGKGIVFGGFDAEQRPNDDPDNPIVMPVAAKRTGARSWKVSGWNLSDGPDDAGRLTSIAYCGKVKGTRAFSKTAMIDPSEAGSVDARCPRGTKLRYGGFKATARDSAASLITGLQRVDRRTFRASQFVLFGSEPLPLTAIAYCR